MKAIHRRFAPSTHRCSSRVDEDLGSLEEGSVPACPCRSLFVSRGCFGARVRSRWRSGAVGRSVVVRVRE